MLGSSSPYPTESASRWRLGPDDVAMVALAQVLVGHRHHAQLLQHPDEVGNGRLAPAGGRDVGVDGRLGGGQGCRLHVI